MDHYQLIVIGAGPGGYMAALRAAKLGLRTAVVESREAGGTCLNRGCVPTKALLHASGIYREAREGAGAGIMAKDVEIDLPVMFARQKEISAKLSAGIEGLFKSTKVAYLQGTGQITAPRARAPPPAALRARIPACRASVTTGQKATDTLRAVAGCGEPPVGGSVEFRYAGRTMRLYRMPSSSRAYPRPVEWKAGFYRAMFAETVGI